MLIFSSDLSSSPAVINGEKATLETPTFAQKRQRTLDMLIRSLYQDLMPDLHKVPLPSDSESCSFLNERPFFFFFLLSKLSPPCHFSYC